MAPSKRKPLETFSTAQLIAIARSNLRHARRAIGSAWRETAEVERVWQRRPLKT